MNKKVVCVGLDVDDTQYHDSAQLLDMRRVQAGMLTTFYVFRQFRLVFVASTNLARLGGVFAEMKQVDPNFGGEGIGASQTPPLIIIIVG